MFRFATPSRATLLLALVSTLVSADPSSHGHKRLDVGRRHHAVDIAERDAHFGKRFENTRFTFFDAGTNACGGFDHDSDFIAALNTHQWDGGSHCYEPITVSYKGKSVKAKITDMCVECPYGAIDLSPSLFLDLVPGGFDQGVAYGSWLFGSEEPAPEPKTTTTTKHTTTTSKQEPTTTSTKRTTTSKSTTTSAKTSATTISTSTAAAPTVTSFDNGNINQFNLAVIQLVGLGFGSDDDAQ